MKSYALFVLFIMAGLNARAQLGNYDAGGAVPVITSRQQLIIDTTQVRLQGSEQIAAVLGSLIPPVADLATTLIQTSLKADAARYESRFVVNASASGFWISEKQVALPELVITREVLLRGQQEKGLQPALRIVLRPELSPDKTAFRLVVASPMTYRYSGAKTRKEYDYIHVDLLINLSSLTVNEGQYRLVPLRSTVLSIPMLKPGMTVDLPSAPVASGWIPFPPAPSFGVVSESAEEEVRTVSTSGTNNGKPDNDTLTTTTRIIQRNQPMVQKLYRNAGLYEFEVTVIETNPYKVKAAVRNEFLSKAVDPAAEVLKAGF